jgi:hypothetical protein
MTIIIGICISTSNPFNLLYLNHIQERVFAVSIGIQPDAVFTLLQPPDVLHQASNLHYQRNLPSKKFDAASIKYSCSSEILLASQPNQSPCPSSDLPSEPGEASIGSANIGSDHTNRIHPAECRADSPPAEEGNNCIICLEQSSDAVLLECGHSGLCVDCASVLWTRARRCPLCRQGFAAVVRIVDRDGSTVFCSLIKQPTFCADIDIDTCVWHGDRI